MIQDHVALRHNTPAYSMTQRHKVVELETTTKPKATDSSQSGTNTAASSSNDESKDSTQATKEKSSKPVSAMFTPNSHWAPSIYTAFKILLSLRITSAIWCPIGDCDEVYNYWEPLHLLLYGRGFQTWEYSPEYGLRSYLYLGLYYFPAKLFQTFLPDAKVQTFYFARCFIALMSTVVDVLFYSTVCQRVSNNVGRLYLLIRALGPGAFVSASAFLPSSFVETSTLLAATLLLRDQWFGSVLAVAAGSLIGWPFAAVLGAPIAFDMLFFRKMYKKFTVYALSAGVAIASVLVIVDSYFYGKLTLAPLNIVLYNVFSGAGPALYGVEPVSYYLVNLLLNWNVAFLAALSSIPVLLIVFWTCYKFRDWRIYTPLALMQISMWLWMVIFFYQPHKEERFMYPIYWVICLSAACSIDGIHRLWSLFCRNLVKNKKLNVIGDIFVIIFIVLLSLSSLSRICAVYRNYYAPFDVFMALNEQNTVDGESHVQKSLCVGKEWYRFPSSFFLPPNYHLNFVQSEFRGILPKPYDDRLTFPAITRAIPSHMNSMNLEEPSRYIDIDQCHFMVDLDLGTNGSSLEPNYSKLVDHWTILYSSKFLNSPKSNRFFRAFYIPFIGDRYTSFGSYNLLKRNKRG